MERSLFLAQIQRTPNRLRRQVRTLEHLYSADGSRRSVSVCRKRRTTSDSRCGELRQDRKNTVDAVFDSFRGDKQAERTCRKRPAIRLERGKVGEYFSCDSRRE